MNKWGNSDLLYNKFDSYIINITYEDYNDLSAEQNINTFKNFST